MANPIGIVNLGSFQASLDAAKAKISDLSKPLTQMGLSWLRANQAYFTQSPGIFADLSGGRSGRDARGRFRSKNAGYKAEKLRRWGFVYPVLVASGALRRSLTEVGATGNVFQVGPQSLLVGSSIRSKTGAPYPRFLRDGTRTMPARNYLIVSELTIAGWKKTLAAYVAGVARSQGKSITG